MVCANGIVGSLCDGEVLTFNQIHVWWHTWAVVTQQDSLETSVDSAIGSQKWHNWPSVDGIVHIARRKTVKDKIARIDGSSAITSSASPLPKFWMVIRFDVTCVKTDPIIRETFEVTPVLEGDCNSFTAIIFNLVRNNRGFSHIFANCNITSSAGA